MYCFVMNCFAMSHFQKYQASFVTIHQELFADYQKRRQEHHEEIEYQARGERASISKKLNPLYVVLALVDIDQRCKVN